MRDMRKLVNAVFVQIITSHIYVTIIIVIIIIESYPFQNWAHVLLLMCCCSTSRYRSRL